MVPLLAALCRAGTLADAALSDTPHASRDATASNAARDLRRFIFFSSQLSSWLIPGDPVVNVLLALSFLLTTICDRPYTRCTPGGNRRQGNAGSCPKDDLLGGRSDSGPS